MHLQDAKEKHLESINFKRDDWIQINWVLIGNRDLAYRLMLKPAGLVNVTSSSNQTVSWWCPLLCEAQPNEEV